MCEPITIGLIVGAGVIGTGVAGAVEQQKQAEAVKDASATQLQYDQAKIKATLEGEAEQAAEQQLELSRQAAEDRGRVQNLGLGDSSVRALSRAVGFELGQEKATVQKNIRTANRVAADRLHTARLTHENNKIAAGDTSGARLGLSITGALFNGIASGLSAAASFSSLQVPDPAAANAADVLPPDALDASSTRTDFVIS